MNQNQHYDNLCAAAKHFGLVAQMTKTQEELRELCDVLELCRGDNVTPYMEALCGEIADVYNMLDQLCILINCEEAVQEIAEQKMERTMERYGIVGG